jgi:hypothetical protein
MCGLILPRSRRRRKSVRAVLRISPYSLSVSCIKPPAMLPAGPPGYGYRSMTCGADSCRIATVRPHPFLPLVRSIRAATVSLRRRCRRPRGGPSTAAACSSPSSSWRPRSSSSSRPPPPHGSSHSPPPGTRLAPRMLRGPSRTLWNLTFGFLQGAVAAGLAGHLGAAALGGVAAV